MTYEEPTVANCIWSEVDHGRHLRIEFADGRSQEIWSGTMSPAEMYHQAMLWECRHRREQTKKAA